MKFKRIISVVLMLALVLSFLPMNMVKAEIPYMESEVLFEDDFSAGLNADYWSSYNLTVTDGILSGNGNAYLTKFAEATSWTDYMVEADVRITSGTVPDSVTSGVAAITGRSNSNGTNAYEFGLVYTKATGAISARLYGRGISPTFNKPITVANLEADTFYRLSMVFAGGMIRCYIDGQQVYECYEKTYTSGAPGLKALNVSADYKNFKVTKLSSTPDYAESFDYTDSMTSHSWNIAKTIEDGKMVLSSGCTYLNGIPGAVSWTDYSVEAKVTISEYGTNVATPVAGIAGRVPTPSDDQNKSGGYELCIGYNKANTDTPDSFVRLYRRTDGTVSGKVLKSINTVQIETNTEYIVKMEFEGDVIRCYVNGELVITINDTEYPAGTVGFVTSNPTILADDFKVSSYTPEFSDDFKYESTNGMMDNGWNKNLDDSTGDSGVRLKSSYNKAYLSNLPGASTWRNYTVEALVRYDNNEVTNDKGVMVIMGRCDSNGSGYELGIQRYQAGGFCIRLCDRSLSSPVVKSKTINVKKGVIYRLRMAFEENTITCYIGDEKVFDYETPEVKTGTAGIYLITNGVEEASYYNFRVYPNKGQYTFVPGDADNDGEAAILDVIRAKKYVADADNGYENFWATASMEVYETDFNKTGDVEDADIASLRELLITDGQ